MKNTKRGFIVPLLIVIVILILVGGVYVYTNDKKTSYLEVVSTLPNSIATTTVSQVIAEQTQESTTPPQIQFTTPDYKLFNAPNSFRNGESHNGALQYEMITYAIAGTIDSGKYAGYYLVVAALDIGPSREAFIFATKDFKSFIADYSDYKGDDTSLQLYKTDKIFNHTTVTKIDNLSFKVPPDVIDLGNNFVLTREWFGIENFLNPELSKSVFATSTISGLWIFNNSYYPKHATDFSAAAIETDEGLIFDYMLDTKESLDYYATHAHSSIDRLSTSLPIYYRNTDFDTTLHVYQRYSGFFAYDPSLGELTPVFKTKNGAQVYALKSENSIAYQNEYNAKITSTVKSMSATSTIGRVVNSSIVSVPIPTFEQYVAQNPILFLLNHSGKMVGIHEEDYPTYNEGGYGKPVIYLYPQEPTDVTILFENPINFSINIPTYHNGWRVHASPNGTLKDLQPDSTDCNAIDSTRFGSEYAKDACMSNTYPYIYWAGQTNTPYPTAQNGWVVERANVSDFLNQKLTYIGLSEKERTDMLSYWVPKILLKTAPYYRISFFQTETMNTLVPMKITPEPNTMLRVFLDWSPLAKMPAIQPQPQVLNHVDRKGFTYVEWGGLKQ